MFRERNKKGLEIQQFWQLLEMKTSKWKTMYLCWLPGTCINPFSTKFLLNFQTYCVHAVYSLILNCLLHTHSPPVVQAKAQKKQCVCVGKVWCSSNFSSSKCGSTWQNSCICPAIQQALHSTARLMALQELPRLLKANRRTSCHCWALGNDPKMSAIVIAIKMMS